jgi:hypothetical protein
MVAILLAVLGVLLWLAVGMRWVPGTAGTDSSRPRVVRCRSAWPAPILH